MIGLGKQGPATFPRLSILQAGSHGLAQQAAQRSAVVSRVSVPDLVGKLVLCLGWVPSLSFCVSGEDLPETGGKWLGRWDWSEKTVLCAEGTGQMPTLPGRPATVVWIPSLNHSMTDGMVHPLLELLEMLLPAGPLHPLTTD